MSGAGKTQGLPGIDGKFGCICADPPWHFKSNSRANPGRNALKHYDCQSLTDIATLPVKEHVADNCVLFMWITGPFLAIGAHLPIMKAWGFKPSGMGFDWVKLNPRAGKLFMMEQDFARGTGFTTQKNLEYCLIGKRGRSMRQKVVPALIIDNRREHSRKPEIFRDRVREYVGPEVDVLELFARSSPDDPKWTVWGNETSKFEAA
ncbi:MT-A70 family methyltransferase [Roseibium alexandrii]|uniref:MT-A70 family methyltransferase n=1 Tax=Roseibium alexandrii TaxID=388408 RepID=UPI00375073C4